MADSPGCLTYEAWACLASSNGCVSASAVSYMIQLMKPMIPTAMRVVYVFQPARIAEMEPSSCSISPPILRVQRSCQCEERNSEACTS